MMIRKYSKKSGLLKLNYARHVRTSQKLWKEEDNKDNSTRMISTNFPGKW